MIPRQMDSQNTRSTVMRGYRFWVMINLSALWSRLAQSTIA